MTEHISCDYKRKLNSATCNSNQKWNNKACQFECKNYQKCKEDYSWNPSTYICENIKYLISGADTSVAECDEIVIVIDFISTKKTNTTVTTKVTSTTSIYCRSKKVRDCYILDTVLLVIILLLIITIICYHYTKKKKKKIE